MPECPTKSFLFIGFYFRKDQIHEAEEPYVVLISNNSIVQNEIADQESLTIEIWSMSDQVEREEGKEC